jgi:hypothetical protein
MSSPIKPENALFAGDSVVDKVGNFWLLMEL